MRTAWTDLPRLAVPLTLLVGGQDSTVPPAQAQRVRLKLPSTRVQVLDGLGHLAHEEAPQRVADALAALGLAGAVQRPPRRAA
jgi:magnesium chelatase accessory protein